MAHKCAKNLAKNDLIKLAGLTFRVSQVGVFYDEATISLWPQHRTRHDSQVVICIDKDAVLKTHTDGISS